VNHVDRITSLHGLPDELVAALFIGILRKQKLTFATAQLFLASDCEPVKEAVSKLDLAAGMWPPTYRHGDGD